MDSPAACVGNVNRLDQSLTRLRIRRGPCPQAGNTYQLATEHFAIQQLWTDHGLDWFASH